MSSSGFGCGIALAAAVSALAVFLMASPQDANRVLWHGFLWTTAGCAIGLLVGNGAALSGWVRKKQVQYWMCWALALALVFSGIVDAKTAVTAPLIPLGAMMKGLNQGLYNSPFPADVVFGLIILILIPAMLLMLVIVLPLYWLELLGQSVPFFGMVESLLYTFLLALTIRWLLMPVMVSIVGPMWPGVAVILHDVFIAVPRGAPEKLTRDGWAEVRVRSKLELAIAIGAGLMAVVSWFFVGD